MSTVSISTDDWASASEQYDALLERASKKDLSTINEAQTRYDVIDKLIRDVLGWKHGHVDVEVYTRGEKKEFVDYILSSADNKIIIEAKKIGATFPSPTKRNRLKLQGSVLGSGEIGKAIKQAIKYADSKNAQVVCVTNGSCWCFFSNEPFTEDSYATLLFPFNNPADAERLFNNLAEARVEQGSINEITNSQPLPEDRLISIVRDASARLNRNSIADHISPALNNALQADALLNDAEALEKCFVPTEGRTKFDSTLGIHLSDSKPHFVKPAPRIKTGKKHDILENIVNQDKTNSPPVTLILGSVGSGKSTYLKHFELVSGKDALKKTNTQWIYIDFELMGAGGDPRSFIYDRLKQFLLQLRPIDVGGVDVVKEAYAQDKTNLINGPFALIAKNKEELDKRFTDYIAEEFYRVEPYVEKLFSYLSSQLLCVIIFDNVDLSKDEELELRVFSESIALSKKLRTNVLISLRDTTYVKHRNNPEFNAYELRKLWLDPPPFKSVLSKRLTYSKKILSGKRCEIQMENGAFRLNVPDLSVFFDIVQRSILNGQAGEYIENMADASTRNGLNLVNNFLTSGHIQADRALKIYLTEGKKSYEFPFHEVFKGASLSSWKFFKEDRADCVNLFDSRLGAKRTRLLRLFILELLSRKALNENTVEVEVTECAEMAYAYGASMDNVIEVLNFLNDNGLIKVPSAGAISQNESVAVTRSGAYYLKRLTHTFVYAEQCMFDTAIQDSELWDELTDLTQRIETSHSSGEKMNLRVERIELFVRYILELTQLSIEDNNSKVFKDIKKMTEHILADAKDAQNKANYWDRANQNH